MSESLRQLNSRRSLKGWVVLTEGPFELALNYGPTITGRGWGFDWISRATVFKNKTAACKALKFITSEETRRTARVVSVASVATMQPSVNKQGRIVWHAGDMRCPLKMKDYSSIWKKNALEAEVKANEMLSRAKVLRRNAKKILEYKEL